MLHLPDPVVFRVLCAWATCRDCGQGSGAIAFGVLLCEL